MRIPRSISEKGRERLMQKFRRNAEKRKKSEDENKSLSDTGNDEKNEMSENINVREKPLPKK